MKQGKNAKEMVVAKLMINSNRIDFGNTGASVCKCQNCNIVMPDRKALTKLDIKHLFDKIEQ